MGLSRLKGPSKWARRVSWGKRGAQSEAEVIRPGAGGDAAEALLDSDQISCLSLYFCILQPRQQATGDDG